MTCCVKRIRLREGFFWIEESLEGNLQCARKKFVYL